MPTKKDRPNVLFVFTDQQRWDTVGCYGCNPMNLTPNLDQVAACGVRFENVFTMQPVCAPARGSLQTGKYATQHGVWKNGMTLPESERTIAQDFKDSGYRVGYIGKWHLAGTGTAPVPKNLRGGYDHWEASDVLEHTSHPYDARLFDAENNEMKLPGYRVDALTDRAIHFMAQENDQPFFLFLSYLEPHQQNDWKAFVAPEGYADRCRQKLYVPPDLQGHDGDWEQWLPDYYGMIQRIDENLGRMIEDLDRRGLLNNTIIVFTSDHGCHFRTRNGEYKRSCHESSIRVPLVMYGPGLPQGKVVRNVVSLIDLPPTLLAASGIQIPDRMQGRNAMPLVRGEACDWEDEIFLQISESQVGRAIRTRRWKYSASAPGAPGAGVPAADSYVEEFLYDLLQDPYEQANKIDDPSYKPVARRLRERLRERIVVAGEKEAHIVPRES